MQGLQQGGLEDQELILACESTVQECDNNFKEAGSGSICLQTSVSSTQKETGEESVTGGVKGP